MVCHLQICIQTYVGQFLQPRPTNTSTNISTKNKIQCFRTDQICWWPSWSTLSPHCAASVGSAAFRYINVYSTTPLHANFIPNGLAFKRLLHLLILSRYGPLYIVNKFDQYYTSNIQLMCQQMMPISLVFRNIFL